MIIAGVITFGTAFAAGPLFDGVNVEIINGGKLSVGRLAGPSTPIMAVNAPIVGNPNAVLFNKEYDQITSSRYIYTNVGGLNTDGGGGAYWRGFMMVGPAITESGQNKFPVVSTFAEYNSLTNPTLKRWVISANNGFDIVYRAQDPGILTDLMTLKKDGKIGFGTSAPSEKVEIVGNLKINGNILSDGDICIGNCP